MNPKLYKAMATEKKPKVKRPRKVKEGYVSTQTTGLPHPPNTPIKPNKED